ncbi:MAG: insulinase family protein, partial [Chlamydiia bacterium]|nr:insulinase family protein [Chlamydiia bacterium]
MKKIALLFLLFASALQSASYEEVVDQNSYQVLTPSLQKRKTAKIRLKNGLEAYLVSDPDANQSAAALSFEVGSWNDDPKYPGIAHFLEHLLFLGSETYPEENAYDKQVWDNGGTLNAYTAPDRTVYIFSVNNDAFPTTLDMFSHMFTDPLFSPSGVGRELHAVDQEHDKNIENDGNRAWMIFKETGNPSHPNALFSTGNLETMKGIPPSVVRQWFEKNYHANEAHLSLYSTLPLEELKEMTVRLFSSLPEGERRKTGIDEPLFSKHQEGHIIAIKPVKEIRELSIEWELPREYAANLDASADHLLGYVLRSKHEGSLYTKLKEEGLIDSLSSGIMRAGKENALFSISFDLTPLGAKHFYRVIDQCFATLNNLKNEGIPPYIFQEKKTIALIDYQYQSRIAPYQFVQGHAHSMIDEPLETYPMKSQLFSSYRPEEGEAFLKLLKPEQAAYFLIASPELTGIPPNKKERWLGAEYSLQKISEEALKRWETLSENSLSPLPKQNPYIPTELTLKHQGGSEKLVTPEPTRVIEKERGVLYFWGDTQYHVPEVSWRFFLSTPAIDGSPRQSVL